jgi:hypothetical protein
MGAGAAAYQQLTDTKDSLSQAAQYWGGIEAGKRAQEKVDTRTDLKDHSTKTDTNLKNMQTPLTGEAGFNRALTTFAGPEIKIYRDLANEKKELIRKGKGNTKEAIEIDNEMQLSMSSFREIKGVVGSVLEVLKPYTEDLKAKNVNPLDDKYFMIADAIANGQYNFKRDKGNQPIIEYYDKKGSPMQLSALKFINGFSYSKAYDAMDDLTTFSKENMGMSTNDTDTGDEINREITFSDAALKKLDYKINSILEDGDKAEQAYLQATGKEPEGRILSDPEKEELRTFLETVGKAGGDTENTIKASVKGNLELRRAKDKEAKNKKKKLSEGVLIEPKTNVDGGILSHKAFSPTTGGNQELTYEFNVGSEFPLGPNTNKFITSVFMTRSGKMSYRGYDKSVEEPPADMSASEKETWLAANNNSKDYEQKIIYHVPETLAGDIARKMINPSTNEKFKNLSEFVDYSKSMIDRPPKAKSTVKLGEAKTKSIKSSDIASKAKAAGYTEAEYKALLQKNNIKIIN